MGIPYDNRQFDVNFASKGIVQTCRILVCIYEASAGIHFDGRISLKKFQRQPGAKNDQNPAGDRGDPFRYDFESRQLQAPGNRCRQEQDRQTETQAEQRGIQDRLLPGNLHRNQHPEK